MVHIDDEITFLFQMININEILNFDLDLVCEILLSLWFSPSIVKFVYYDPYHEQLTFGLPS